MAPVADVTGIVLAGGRSSRFGSDKLAAAFRGTPLLHHPVLRLAGVCGDVVVVLAPDAPEPSLPPDAPVRISRDAVPNAGPLAGLYAGLLSVGTERALVAGGDMPELSVPVLRAMTAAAVERGADAVALQEGDRFRPLPCVLRAEPALDLAHVLLHAGRSSLRDLVGGLDLAVLEEAVWTAIDPSGGTLRDVDVPGDLLE